MLRNVHPQFRHWQLSMKVPSAISPTCLPAMDPAVAPNRPPSSAPAKPPSAKPSGPPTAPTMEPSVAPESEFEAPPMAPVMPPMHSPTWRPAWRLMTFVDLQDGHLIMMGFLSIAWREMRWQKKPAPAMTAEGGLRERFANLAIDIYATDKYSDAGPLVGEEM